MGRRLILTLILLATVSVIGIVATQIYWLDKAFEVQKSQYELVKEQEAAEAKLFNDRVKIALSKVANEILTINNDPAELFEAVKQIRPNYFTVAINDTVHPYLLENLLITEFERSNIAENFEYGVYDCFTDSIVYGDYVPLKSENEEESHKAEAPQIKWDKDGHYFGVFFPDRKQVEISPPSQQASTWIFSAIISLIVFIFFAYAIYLILKQKRLSEMKTDFINNMTHELKTPISTIGLSSEVLMRKEILQEPERLEKYAKLIFHENQRLRSQVDKVLQLATLDKDQLELNLSPSDIHRLIESARHAMALARSEENIDIELDLKAAKHVVSCDAVHIANVINSLLDNAVKYSGDSVKIQISTWNKNSSLCIKISDNGIGIAKDALPYIFDKFFRVHTGNLHDVKGFGLGLYYVKQMVEAHGGKVIAESTPGEGTSFLLKLPIAN